MSEQIKEEVFGPRDAEGWYTWIGSETMRPAGAVDIICRGGRYEPLVNAGAVNWKHDGSATDIIKWRQA